MTLDRLRQKRDLTTRIEVILEEPVADRELDDAINDLVDSGIILTPKPGRLPGPAMEELLEMVQEPGKLVITQMSPLFTGGYKENRPRDLPYYHILTHKNAQKGTTFESAFLNAIGGVGFPNNRIGFSWVPEISTKRADNRRRAIPEVSRVVGTILSSDEAYTSQILLNGYRIHGNLRPNYHPGMRNVLTVPSVEYPDITHKVELIGMPVFSRRATGGRLNQEQVNATYNFSQYDDCDFKAPFTLSSRWVPGTPPINDLMVIDHHGKIATDEYIKFIRKYAGGYQIPNIIPNSRQDSITLFWDLYEKAFFVRPDANLSTAESLQAWMVNRGLLNGLGLNNKLR